jgi:hypothetical protein
MLIKKIADIPSHAICFCKALFLNVITDVFIHEKDQNLGYLVLIDRFIRQRMEI